MEFDLTIRAKSEAARDALKGVVGKFSGDYELISTQMVVPEMPIPQGPALFESAEAFLEENPAVTVLDLMHSADKPWSKEIQDLAVLILLSERAIREGNEVAKEGMQNSYKSHFRYSPVGLTFNGYRVSPEEYSRAAFPLLREACLRYAEEPESPVGRLNNYLPRPSETRILIMNRGLAGIKVPNRQILETEGVAQLHTRKDRAESCIYWRMERLVEQRSHLELIEKLRREI